ncbi:MAG: hypothetical protein SGJ16_03130 [Nitrospirota bacterium]|nr:hypothetical protein [Nitrospirota bacterium]
MEIQEGVYKFTLIGLAGEDRQNVEREKSDFLRLEDIKVGSGSIAAWDQKVGARIEIRYADGTFVYRGDVLVYVGLLGSNDSPTIQIWRLYETPKRKGCPPDCDQPNLAHFVEIYLALQQPLGRKHLPSQPLLQHRRLIKGFG